MRIAILLRSGAALRIIASGMALLAGGYSFGQIEVALTVEPVRALLYEPVRAAVVIRNNTGGILDFSGGQDSARFFFEVERGKDEAVRLADRSPLLFGLKLVPAGVATNGFNLTSLFAMQSRGPYKVRAYVEWHNILFASPAVELEILKGFEIARIIAGVPGEQNMVRVYVLEYLPKESGEQVYLRIEDASSKTVYSMNKLGHIVRVRKPEMKVDEAGNVHILFQTMSMVFVHTAFTPYGVQLFSRNYSDRSNSITLLNLPNGQVSVPPMYQAGEKASGIPQATSASSAVQQVPEKKPKLGRGGLLGPKSE